MAPRNEKMPPAGSKGSGTILAAGLALVIVLLVGLVLGLVQASVAASKAAKCADLSALAAADAYRGISAGDPCAIAAQMASLNGAVLSTCSPLSDLSVVVEVTVRSALPWPATALARAGPPPDSVTPAGS